MKGGVREGGEWKLMVLSVSASWQLLNVVFINSLYPFSRNSKTFNSIMCKFFIPNFSQMDNKCGKKGQSGIINVETRGEVG